MKIQDENVKKYIEERMSVSTYISRLKYAIDSSQAKIQFQQERYVDKERDQKYTNRYTMAKLFPNEDPIVALKRELSNIKLEEYIETVKDIRYVKRSDMRVFGRMYDSEGVYIKIRVELLSSASSDAGNFIFVMSFHYSTQGFEGVTFPYGKK